MIRMVHVLLISLLLDPTAFGATTPTVNTTPVIPPSTVYPAGTVPPLPYPPGTLSSSYSPGMFLADSAEIAAYLATLPPPIPPANFEGYYDLSNPSSQSYIASQLNAVGITPQKYPSLYYSLLTALPIYAYANYKKINIPQAVINAEGSQLQPINVVVPTYSGSNSTLTATQTSSIPNSPYVVANTLGLYADSSLIGSSAGSIVVGTGNEVVTTVNEPTQNGVTQYQAGGIVVYVYPASVLGDTAQLLGLTDTTSLALALPLNGTISTASDTTTIINTAPTNVKGNPWIKVCLVRNDADCDYSYPAGPVRMPLSGSVTFPSPVATDPTTGVPSNAYYNVAIWYPDVGGGCQMPDSAFASSVKVSGNVLSWNANPGQFGEVCSLYVDSAYGQTVDVTYQLSMLVQSVTGSMMSATVTTDSTVPSGNGVLQILPMEFLYGCLAQGTLITMDPKGKGGGKTKAIEKVKADEWVLGPGGKGVKVTGYWKGPEKHYLFRILTANGHSVDMTAMHAVPLAGGPTKLAKDLEPGDMLTTDKGPSKISGIARVPAKDKVWNLDLGAPQPSRQTIDMSQHSFYANGILVGDGRAQNHFSRKDREDPAHVLARIPKSWRTDFFNAQLYASEKAKAPKSPPRKPATRKGPAQKPAPSKPKK